jgi:hypothetical protein
MLSHLRRRSSIGAILMAVLILDTGCRGWIERPIRPDTGVATPRRGVMRVTKTDGAILTLSDAVITTDSIVGVLSTPPGVRTAIARADVMKIETRGDTTPRGVRIGGKVYLGVLFALMIPVFVVGIIWIIDDLRGKTSAPLP